MVPKFDFIRICLHVDRLKTQTISDSDALTIIFFLRLNVILVGN